MWVDVMANSMRISNGDVIEAGQGEVGLSLGIVLAESD